METLDAKWGKDWGRMPGVEMRQDGGVHVVTPAAGRYNMFEKDALSKKLKPWDALRVKYAASADDVASLMSAVKHSFPSEGDRSVLHQLLQGRSDRAQRHCAHHGVEPFQRGVLQREFVLG